MPKSYESGKSNPLDGDDNDEDDNDFDQEESTRVRSSSRRQRPKHKRGSKNPNVRVSRSSSSSPSSLFKRNSRRRRVYRSRRHRPKRKRAHGKKHNPTKAKTDGSNETVHSSDQDQDSTLSLPSGSDVRNDSRSDEFLDESDSDSSLSTSSRSSSSSARVNSSSDFEQEEAILFDDFDASIESDDESSPPSIGSSHASSRGGRSRFAESDDEARTRGNVCKDCARKGPHYSRTRYPKYYSMSAPTARSSSVLKTKMTSKAPVPMLSKKGFKAKSPIGRRPVKLSEFTLEESPGHESDFSKGKVNFVKKQKMLTDSPIISPRSSSKIMPTPFGLARLEFRKQPSEMVENLNCQELLTTIDNNQASFVRSLNGHLQQETGNFEEFQREMVTAIERAYADVLTQLQSLTEQVQMGEQGKQQTPPSPTISPSKKNDNNPNGL